MTDERYGLGGEQVPEAESDHVHDANCEYEPVVPTPTAAKPALSKAESVKVTELVMQLVQQVGRGILEKDDEQVKQVLKTFRSFIQDDPKSFVYLSEAILLAFAHFMVEKFKAEEDNNG